MGAGLLETALTLALLAGPVCTEVPVPDVRQYRNVEYQFSVAIPPGLRGCKISSPCPNHGLWIPLGPVSTCARSHEGSRYIDVDAEYNTIDDVNTADRLAAIQCRWRDARHIVWLDGERLSGRKAAGCRREFPDGHIEVTLLALRRTDRDPLQWIAVSANLVTTPSHYRSDIGIYRQILRGIWVHPDGPHR
jgi:hypothetical protein